MPFLTQGKTNWKFLLIVIVLAMIVGGGILWCGTRKGVSSGLSPKEELSEVKNGESKKGCPEEVFLDGDIMGRIIDDSLLELIREYLPIPENVNEFLKENEYALCQQVIFTIYGEEIRLNEDKIPEYVISPLALYVSDSIHSFHDDDGRLIFGKIKDNWQFLGRIGKEGGIKLLEEQSNGYFNIIHYYSVGPGRNFVSEYAWDGGVYELIKETEFEENVPGRYQEALKDF